MSNTNNTLAYLRLVCSSNMSPDVTITELLRAIPMLVASNSNAFSVGDKQLRPQYCYAGFDVGDMAETIPIATEELHNEKNNARALSWFQRESTITDPQILTPDFYRTSMYNQVYRRFDMHHVLFAPVSLNEHQTGVLGLYRPRTQSPFDQQEQALVQQLLPYIAHAFNAPSQMGPFVETAEVTAMLIMDSQGALCYKSAEAEQMLQKIGDSQLQRRSSARWQLHERLKRICHDLCAIQKGAPAQPPSFSHSGPFGEFRFRGSWLEHREEVDKRLIGITIEHRPPLTLKLLHGLRDTSLSPTQQRVAMFVAQGKSFEQIGTELNVKPTTVKDHVGKIYLKLNINQREELLPTLLNTAQHGRR